MSLIRKNGKKHVNEIFLGWFFFFNLDLMDKNDE